MTESQELYNDIAGLLETKGLKLVDLSLSRNQGAIQQVRAVIYRAEGTGIDECAKAHRLMQPRLEMLLGDDDFQLEVSSPGLDRVIRSGREYAVFVGRGVCLSLKDETVVCGRIVSASLENVVLSTEGAERSIPLDLVRKGKLDYSQEGR
ncbi:MAG: ribosome maturation factor [Clostridia bacterium]|jgi:ribosome maturation factor RimP